jgi:sugar/nucleoside kinase (ribokinase family)
MSPPRSARSGIIAGGNWIIDHVKLIDGWPPQETLANIRSESWSNGGAPYNLLKDLARLGGSIPLAAIGLVGNDADGERILDDCRRHGIDTAQLRRTAEAPTSYSDVMTDAATGRRTFFHARGANALLGPEHFDFSATPARIFHLGYLLLLDRLDRLVNGWPCVGDVLRRASAAGLLTSIDCVSENSDRFQAVVRPVLPGVDVLFANDFETEKITGAALRSPADGSIRRPEVEAAARALADLGVRRWVVLHFPEGAYAVDPAGRGHWQPSLHVPPEAVRGTAGAGDAFASGVLHGLHEEWPIDRALRLGVCAAASSLSDPTCSAGVLPVDACLRLPAAYGWRE